MTPHDLTGSAAAPSTAKTTRRPVPAAPEANPAGLVGYGLEALREVLHGIVPLHDLHEVILSLPEYRQLAADATLQVNLAQHVQGHFYPSAKDLQLYREMEAMLIYLLENQFICVSGRPQPTRQHKLAWHKAARRRERRTVIRIAR